MPSSRTVKRPPVALERQLARLPDFRAQHLMAVKVKGLLRFGGDEATQLPVDQRRSLETQQAGRGEIGFQHFTDLIQGQQGERGKIVQV